MAAPGPISSAQTPAGRKLESYSKRGDIITHLTRAPSASADAMRLSGENGPRAYLNPSSTPFFKVGPTSPGQLDRSSLPPLSPLGVSSPFWRTEMLKEGLVVTWAVPGLA